MARTPRQILGDRGEEAAFDHLARAGYRVLARNVRCGGGELDGVALDGRTVCFIEVKSVAAGAGVEPESHITPRKIHALRRAAWYYLRLHRLDAGAVAARFDVVAVRFDGERAEVTVHKAAF